jgi:hypothetical protein
VGGGGGLPSPRFTTYYFFFAAFFFAAFFLAFFFAAIIVSFKVNLGMLHVRWLLAASHSHHTIFRTLHRLLFHRSPEKNFGKTVRGAAILCYGLKKKQHLCQEYLTMEYALCGCRNI